MCSNFRAGSKSVPFPKKCYKDPKRTHLSVALDGLGLGIIYVFNIFIYLYTYIEYLLVSVFITNSLYSICAYECVAEIQNYGQPSVEWWFWNCGDLFVRIPRWIVDLRPATIELWVDPTKMWVSWPGFGGCSSIHVHRFCFYTLDLWMAPDWMSHLSITLAQATSRFPRDEKKRCWRKVGKSALLPKICRENHKKTCHEISSHCHCTFIQRPSFGPTMEDPLGRPMTDWKHHICCGTPSPEDIQWNYRLNQILWYDLWWFML